MGGVTIDWPTDHGFANSTTQSVRVSELHGTSAHHSSPASWTIDENDNNPLYFGLDIIYIDIQVWEGTQRRFPEGAVILSSSVLSDTHLSRLSEADGKYIRNCEPGTTGGSSTPQSHIVQGTTGSYGNDDLVALGSGGPTRTTTLSHAHVVKVPSSAVYAEPRNLVTRLYEALARTMKANENSVVFVDGTPGSNWEILTSWAGGNIKGGDSNPTLSGNDMHTQTLSNPGNTEPFEGTPVSGPTSGEWVTQNGHKHPMTLGSSTLSSAYHVPESTLLIPARLKTTLYASTETVIVIMT